LQVIRVFFPNLQPLRRRTFDKGLKDLRDKRLLPVDFNNVSKIEIVSPKLNLAF